MPSPSVLPLSGQDWQVDTEMAPRAVEKVLRGQPRQGCPGMSWYVPAPQGTQLVLRTDPVVFVVLPRGQSAQAEKPGEGAKLPASHLLQEEEEVLPAREL